MLFHAAILFISAGRLDWVMAWAFVGVYATNGAIIALLVKSELIAERAKTKADAKGWDKVLSNLIRLSFLAAPLIAGLDMRFGWTQQIPLAIQLVALVFFALGYGLTSWAMISNKFFSAVVRIQMDRGHTVVSTGPYQYVRHPGYVASILFLIATPLILGSVWAFIPSGLAVLLCIVRTVFEDKTLLEELDGYEDYARRVRYRLLPGIW